MSSIPPKTITATSGEQVIIRTALPDDAAGLLAYIHCISREPDLTLMEPDELPATEKKEREWVQDHLDHPGKIVLVAETASGAIIAGLSFENGAYRRISHRGSFGISVLKEWRGRGVGTALLSMLLEWATANPLIEKVCLHVSTSNEGAIRLYKRLGFVEEGMRPKEIKFGPGRYADGISMHKFVESQSIR